MDAYSQDLRERVLRALERGDRPTAIADRFEVSRVWVYQGQTRLKQTGQRCSLPIGVTGGPGWSGWRRRFGPG